MHAPTHALTHALTHGSTQSAVRPLLKWAGGKRQLLPALGLHYPETFTRYLEPFFGSGAVFFDLAGRGRLDGRGAALADVNPDLVGCYRVVRDRPDEVIAALAVLEREHRARGDACYYEVRDERFNPARAALAARGVDATVAAYTPELAAMLILLNRTGFNGLYRLNRRGAFNVPAGRYREPRICDAEHVRAVSRALRGSRVTIDCVPFDVMLGRAGAGDFVYCDPPYAPLTATASFAQYTAAGFTAFDQVRLQQAVVAACGRGAAVVLSNSSAPDIVRVYSTSAARAAGLVLQKVPARRAINSRSAARGPVEEIIVSNVGRQKLRMAKAGPRTAAARIGVRRVG